MKLNFPLVALFCAICALATAPVKAAIVLDANSSVSGTDPGVTLVGSWNSSSSVSGFIGTAYLHDGNTDKGMKSVAYSTPLASDGMYQVDINYASDGNRSNNTPVDIIHNGGTTTVVVDQTVGGGIWQSLGMYNFTGTANSLIRTDGTTGFVIADGMRFTQINQLARDTFIDYPVGSNLNGGNGGVGFAGPWATSGSVVTVQNATLNSTNGQYTGNGQVMQVNPTTNINELSNAAQRSFPTFTGDTLYVGMLMRTENVSGNDFIQFQVSDGPANTGNVANTLSFGISNDAANSFFTRVGTSGSGDTDLISTAMNGTDYTLVAKISKGTNGQYERIDLFIDPTGIIEPTTPDGTSFDSESNLTQLGHFNLRLNNFETDDFLLLDQLVFSETFAGALLANLTVVPEPTSAIIWGALALVGIPFARRRRGK